ELICPRCLVQTPVGARCPDCAAERKNPVFDPSATEIGRAAIAAIAVGVAVAIAGWVLWNLLPSLFRYVQILTPAAAGWLIGATTYRASGFKRSRRLQLASGVATLISFFLLFYLVGVVGTGAFIGLAVGVWYAIGRVKPPRGT
ncbi:MAG: hypothetical protein HQ548_08430, partial [Chloroflexi bacterium]|nr:hypothetical protein [Chloroflexota bacterium]